jgi:hypothetical protein
LGQHKISAAQAHTQGYNALVASHALAGAMAEAEIAQTDNVNEDQLPLVLHNQEIEPAKERLD